MSSCPKQTHSPSAELQSPPIGKFLATVLVQMGISIWGVVKQHSMGRKKWPTAQHTPAEHRGAHWKQDLRHWAASLYVQGLHHRPTGDPLHNCRQASDSQLLTRWVNSEQESRPCHVCARAVGMVTGRPVSRSIRDWMVVRRRRGLQDRQRLQTSTLATYSSHHPDIPTPQSARWRLQIKG